MVDAQTADAEIDAPGSPLRPGQRDERDRRPQSRCALPRRVERLVAFENYSKGCENRDEKDAEVHRTLWFATTRARRIMEDALEQLLKHEGFVVDGDTVRRLAS